MDWVDGGGLIGTLTGLAGGGVMMPPLIFGFGIDDRGSGLAHACLILTSATSKTAQTATKKGGENVTGADPAGGVRLAQREQPRDLEIGRKGQVWENRQDGWHKQG